MRDSEELALALFHAWHRYETGENPNEIEWQDIGEFQQEGYLDQVNVAFAWLFKHGRISQYINATQLEEVSKEYAAYLAAKEQRAS